MKSLIVYEFLPSHTTESDSEVGPLNYGYILGCIILADVSHLLSSKGRILCTIDNIY